MRTNCYPLEYKKLIIEHYLKHKNSVRYVANIFGISKSSLYNWINLYKNKLLTIKKKYTRKTKITTNIINFIKDYIKKNIIIDRYKIMQLIKNKYDTKISKTSLYNILRINKITRKRIRTKYIIKNIKKHKKEKQDFFKNMKKISHDKIISVDETHIDTHIYGQYGWCEKGKRIIINKHVCSKTRYTLILGISNKKIVHYKLILGSANAKKFNDFINELSKKITVNDIYILMDNARIHHAKIVKKNMDNLKLKTLFNVAYMPEYNPIEKMFSIMKHKIRSYNNNHIKASLISNIKESMSGIKEKVFENIYKKSLSF